MPAQTCEASRDQGCGMVSEIATGRWNMGLVAAREADAERAW
jgi:hypothetical protein